MSTKKKHSKAVQDNPEILQSTLESLYLDDTTLKEIIESTRLDMTPDRTIELMADIADNTEDIDALDPAPVIKMAFIVREAYTRGVLVGLNSYREAIQATLTGIKGR